MASTSSPLSKPVAPQTKRLSDLLQEQQEPFLLDVYLLERGYGNKILNSKCRDKKKKVNPLAPKILRCIFNKLTSVTDNRKLSKCNSTRTNAGHKNHQVSEFDDQFSSATSTTLSESCSGSDIEEVSQSYQQQQQQQPPCSSSSSTNRDQQAPTDRSRTNQWGCIEADSKQHSPVSVLDHELHFDEASPLHIHSKAVPSSSRTSKKKIRPSTSSTKKLNEKSIFSASLWELLVQSLVEKQGIIGITEVQELLGTSSSSSSISSQYLKTKRVLEQTKQLLFDCVREAVKTHRSKGRRQQQCITDVFGSEELGKIICEQICSWGKQSGNLTNITHVLKSDFWVSKEEWSDFQLETREIGMDIGDAILDDISNEIVTDMVDCFLH